MQLCSLPPPSVIFSQDAVFLPGYEFNSASPPLRAPRCQQMPLEQTVSESSSNGESFRSTREPHDDCRARWLKWRDQVPEFHFPLPEHRYLRSGRSVMDQMFAVQAGQRTAKICPHRMREPVG